MKILMTLDQERTKAVYDLLNQTILRELVGSERSVTALAKGMEMPVLKVWRRVQRLESLGLVQVSGARKSGNVETKLYRAAAARFVPDQFLSFKPKDARLREAFSIYSEFQDEFARIVSGLNEVPEGWDPVDYSFYAIMRAFAKVHGAPETRRRVSALAQKLAEFEGEAFPDAGSRPPAG
ncbi:MAG: winged helix-turn-helix transcriptional regulator [Nitrososphaerota archaeon]|nr:winged helix-turn-helix transcriptional regulator [Nitrososphaerota archaeon]MDG6978687.1 winged helix-turn-helix transcriptional regulator [Nitrososphaerota archaeon]